MESGNVPGGAGGLYDFLYREHTPVQGRWLSPDPSGLTAANPADPQTWNRYAYVGNRPLNSVDPLGLVSLPCGPVDCGGGGGSPCDPSLGDPNCIGGCDVFIDPFCDPSGGGGAGGGGGGSGGGGSSPRASLQRDGGVWPGNETTGLPSVPNTQPLNIGNLLSFAPGLGCGGSGGLGFTTSTPVPSNNACVVLTITIVLAVEAVAENSSTNNSNNTDTSCKATTLPGAALFDWCKDNGWVTVAGFNCNGNVTCCQTKRSGFDATCLARNDYYDKKAGVKRYEPIDKDLLQSVDAVCCKKW